MIAYFALKLHQTGMGTIFDIAIIVSVFSFLIGLILSRKRSQPSLG
jgi:multisubunit Na+/H+ antiporter MnhF subunit